MAKIKSSRGVTTGFRGGRGDKALSYGDLMEVMNTLRDAGYLKLALVGLEAPATKQ